MLKTVKTTGMLVVVLFLSAAVVTGQDKKDKGKKGSLPANYGKLGLSDDQKKKIYAIQDEYGTKIADLKKQIDELTKKEHQEWYAILTDDQKEQLKKIQAEKAGDPGKPTEKKPTDKPTDK